MEQDDVAYLAGVVDSTANFRLHIKEEEQNKTGYSMTPEVNLNRSDPQTIVFGMVEEYCLDIGVGWSMSETEASVEFTITGTDDILDFLEPIAPYIIQQHECFVIFVEEIIPAIEQGEHRTKEGFYEVVKAMNKMYRKDPTLTHWKYTTDYFQNRWRDELY